MGDSQMLTMARGRSTVTVEEKMKSSRAGIIIHKLLPM